jgi:hypothetical protein
MAVNKMGTERVSRLARTLDEVVVNALRTFGKIESHVNAEPLVESDNRGKFSLAIPMSWNPRENEEICVYVTVDEKCM